MTETDYSPIFSTTPSSIFENSENQKPTLTARERIKEKLERLRKFRPLNISKPKNGEIVLETFETKKNEDEIDAAATKWIMDKADLKEAPILITKSPKTAVKKKVISKQRALKLELQEKLKVRRKDEQEERYMVYNADNEIVDDDEEENFDDDFELPDAKEKKSAEGSNESKKPKIRVNEDEEIIEEDDSEVDDEEDELISDEEEDEEEEEKSKNPFVDDEASEDEDADNEEDEEKSTKFVPSRLVISDDEDDVVVVKNKPKSLFDDVVKAKDKNASLFDDEDNDVVKVKEKNATLFDDEEESAEASFETPDIPTPQNNSATENSPKLILPNCLTQRLDPYEGQQCPIEPDPSQRSICLDTQAEKDELLMLCSGSFGTQKSDETLCSKFEKYDVMDFLSDSSQLPDSQSQNLQKADSIEKFPTDISETQRRIDAIYEAFNNAEDSMDTVDFSDSDCEQPETRKRKIVVYSDDEDEEIEPSKPKHPKILDFDDSDIDEAGEESKLPSFSQPNNNALPMDFDDIFTTEDTSNNPGFTEDIQSEQEDEEEEERDSDDERDIIGYESENDDVDVLRQPDKMLKEFVDDEASLSGDDVGDDPDDEDNDNVFDDYELDEADKEEYDEEDLRRDLVQHHMKHVQNEDEKQLYRLQQKYFADGDLHGAGNMDRSFRFRMNKDITDEDWAKLVKMNPVLAGNVSDDENDEDLLSKKKSFEFKKWKHEKTNEDNEKEEEEDDLLGDFDTPLFSLGKRAMKKPLFKFSTKTTSSITRGSLLNNPSSLGVLIKDTVTETKINTLFTAMK